MAGWTGIRSRARARVSQDRAYAVSYNRPFITDDGTSTASGAQDYVFGADYAAIYWLEKNGYDVSYISGVDTDRMGANYLTNYKAYISVGHDEYWSGGQRANVEAARDAGVNLLFWSGNECYWKTRWETATSADGTPYRTLVCYKETLAVVDANAGPSDYYNLDPTNTWTGTWRDTRFHGNPLAGGGNPQDVDPITGLNPSCHCGENLLTGQLFGPDGTGQFGGALDVPASFAGLRMWRDTTVANGGKLDIAPGILGYEWDTSPDNLQRPAGLIKLSDTTIPWNGILVDQGNTVAPGSATHNLSLYRAPSGALVFGAGTTFWSWGLSDEHDSSPYGAQIENTDIKQFTVNMFADMGIQPGVADAVLASQGLTRASASNDTHAATTSIDTLGQVAALSPVTITGTATDNDGNAATVDGKVAVVEVSLDGGSSWHVADTANGWATWSFHWQPSATGNYTIRARAIDDSLNVSNIVADTETVTVTAPNAYSLFNATTPGNATVANDGTSIELGMRFSVDRVGTATELKYWRSSQDAADTDVRQGHLWRADGTLLATVTFTSAPGESGWQTATLSSPVGLTPGVEYVVSYRTANNYVATNDFFSDAHDVSFDGLNNNSFWGPFGVIRAAQDGVGGGNGLYLYGGGAAAMPTQTYNASNYWVDLTFDPTESAGNRPPSFTSAASFTRPENNTTVGIVSATDPDGNALAYAIAGGTDAARFSINASTGVLAFLTSPNFEAPSDADANNVYQLNVSVSDGLAAPVTQAVQVTVTDINESGAMSHLFGASGTPATIKTDDPTDYELGAKFQSNSAGWISALYYYRGGADAGDVDVRTLNLWTVAGVKLGQVTVTSDQGASGWQIGTLNTPIAIQANTTYVVSYGTTQNYAFTANYFATAQTGPDGVLTGLASGASGGNGVFANGTPGAFPTSTYQSANYWVDVGFVSALGHAPVITSPASFSMAENLTLAGTVTATDADGDALTYTLAGGADQARFTINATTGVLSFLTAPNFEVPTDVGANNVYNVTVAVSDGKLPAVQQAVAVTVNNAVEPNQLPTILPIVAPTTNEDAAAVQINLLAGASDPDNDPVTVLTPITVTSSNASRTVAFTLNAAGVLTLNPAQFGDLTTGQSEVVTVSYMITDGVPIDGSGVSNTATITVEGRAEVGQTITGTSASNTLIGGDAADTISGLGGNDSLQGNGGNDTLDGGTGTDNVNGGAGDDLIIVRGTEAQGDTMTGGTGIDTLRITGTADLTLNGTALITEIEVFDGGGRALRGTNSVANVLDLSGFTTVTNLTQVLGLSGADSLTGSSGADTLDGGADIDTVRGGGGDDTIVIRGTEALGDTMVGGTGTDTLRLAATADLNGTSLITEIEVLDGAGFSLRGTSGVNVLDLSGFATVTNLASVLGLAGNDTLVGSSGNDTLNGGSGVDTVRGGAGNDTILVSGTEASTDTMDGGIGQDRILVSAAGGSFVLSGTSRLAGIEQIDGAGVEIRGTSAADTFDFSGISLVNVAAINGLGGADTLKGSAGADVMTGGTGNDSFVFQAGQVTGADQITDFDMSGNDVIRLVGYNPSVDLAAATRNVAGGALIELGGDGTILLVGVTKSLSFTTEDFVFA